MPRWASFSATKEVLTLQQMTLRESKEQEAAEFFQTWEILGGDKDKMV